MKPRSQTVSRPKPKEKLTQTVINLAHLINIINTHENYLQSIREALISEGDFNPKNLFYHLSGGEDVITRRDLCYFMESSDEEI